MPSASTQARPPWVSSAACWTRWVVKVPSIGDGGLRQRGSRRRRIRRGFPRRCCGWRCATRCCRRLVAVDHRRARRDRLLGIDHRRQDFVVDLEPPAAFLGGGLGLGDHGGDLLPDEADDVVEHAGVVRIHPVPLVPRGREQAVRRVLEASAPRARRERRAPPLVDRDDLRVRMRRAQQS